MVMGIKLKNLRRALSATKNPVDNASSSTTTKPGSSTTGKSAKKDTSNASPPDTSHTGRSIPNKEQDKPAKISSSNKRTSGFSRRSVQKSIVRTLSNLSIKSSRYSKLPNSLDHSSESENSGASCGLENRNYPSSSSTRSSIPAKGRSTGMRSAAKGSEFKGASKSATPVDPATLSGPSSAGEPPLSSNVNRSTSKASITEDSPTPRKKTSCLSNSAKRSTKGTSDAKSAAQTQSESTKSMLPSSVKTSASVTKSSTHIRSDSAEALFPSSLHTSASITKSPTYIQSESAKSVLPCSLYQSVPAKSPISIQSESAKSLPSSLTKPTTVSKSSTSKKRSEAIKTSSTLETAISLNSTPLPKQRTRSKRSSSRKPSPSRKQPTNLASGSNPRGNRGLALISGDRGKRAHPKPEPLTAAKRNDLDGRNTRPSSSKHKASAKTSAKRVHVHHHHIVVPSSYGDGFSHRRPCFRPPSPVVCPICRCDIQATTYSRLGCCFDCGSQHGYCSVSSDDYR